jgi:hypothetical protein
MINGYVIAGALLFVGIVSAASYFAGHSNGTENAELKAKVAMDAHLAADAKAEAEQKEKVRELEADVLEQQTAASEAYERGRKDAEAIGEAVAADLRAGALRLQQRWSGCEAARRLPGPAAPAAESDAAAGDREESAARIVRAAAECDAQVRGLQDLLIRERALLGRPSSSSRR